ncbi:MAG: type II secretion system protein GspK [Armatimonadetes bacterium]|nr:type II secretion system protein GspK [Armatimonadota bacterium]
MISRRRGQALVPVLFVMVILVSVAVTLTLRVRGDNRTSAAAVAEAQAHWIARGAVTSMAAELAQASNGGAVAPEIAPPADTDANGWTRAGDGWYRVEVVDTASRLNVNLATAASLAALPVLKDDPSLACAIVDWRDADETPVTYNGGQGAESDAYQALPRPYSAKNAPFDTLGELLLLRGFTVEMLYGAAEGAAGAPDLASGTRQEAVETTEATPPLCELLTTNSRERNVDATGTQRTNILTATAEALVSRLGISRTLADRLVQRRSQSGAEGVKNVSDLLNVPGFTRTVMQSIGDKVTATDDQFRAGVVNVNQAPGEVLAALPGVDQAVLSALMTARQGGTVFAGLNDVFQLTALNRQQLQVLIDNLCTKSSVYLVRVRVRMPGLAMPYVVEALVDLPAPATSAVEAAADAQSAPAPGRVLQWREVARNPGWSSWRPPSRPTTGGP